MAHKTASQIGKSNVSRSKAHERQVARWLTDWSGVEFRRRRAEGRGAAVIEIEGAADVIPVGADFLFSVEAKCGNGFSFDAMFTNLSTALFTSWWHQATYDANLMRSSRCRPIFPMIFLRPIKNSNWVAFPVETLKHLRQHGQLIPVADQPLSTFPHLLFNGYGPYGPIAGNISHSPKHKKIVDLVLADVVFCRLHDFVSFIDPKSAFTS